LLKTKIRRICHIALHFIGGEASSFDSDQEEGNVETFIDPSDDPSIRSAQLTAHHYVMNRLAHHFFARYLHIDRKRK
jgi:hypothetical protein